jgi:hypothetical protein
MVHIVTLEKPALGRVKMSCDDVIHSKLTKYPMIEEAFSTSHFTVICGRMGQGKTSLITQWVKGVMNKCFETIYVFIPENSRASIENDIYGKNLPRDQLFSTLTPEGLQGVYENLQDDTKEGYHSLLIIDDFNAQLKDPLIINILQKIITKMRHLRCSIFLLQQNFQALVKPLRELVSNVVVFNFGKSQLTKVFDEVVQTDKDKFQSIVDVCFRDPHDWLLINLHKSRSIYRNYDLVVL